MQESRGKNGNPITESHVEDVDLSIQLNRWILRPIGVWPNLSKVSWAEKCLTRTTNALCYSLMCFLLIPCVLCAVLEVEDMHDKIKLTGPMIFFVMAILKYYFLIARGDDIRECIKHIETDWRAVRHYKDRSIMTENAIFGRRLTTVCAFFLYSGAVFYYLALPAKTGRMLSENDNLTFIPLIYPVPSTIVDTRRSPANEVFFALHCFTGFLAHNITAGACSLAAVFAMHACGQMEILMSWLGHLVDGREDLCVDVDGRLAEIIERHLGVLRFLALTEKILRQISLVEVVGCTLIMCLLGDYIITEWDSQNTTGVVTYVVLLISFTFNIFIFCYIGEIVAEQVPSEFNLEIFRRIMCARIGETSYMTDWYRLPGKKSLGLILMNAMSVSSIKLTAGNLIQLSLRNFGDVVKAAVTYLNMLRTVTRS